jgi:nucleoside phosphorylase
VRIAIFSAFPQELRQILKNFKTMKRVKRYPCTLFLTEYSSCEIIVVQTGMKIDNAKATLEYIIEENSPDFILSIGFGGALYDGAMIGDLVWASRVFLIPEGIKEKSTAISVNSEYADSSCRWELYLLKVPDIGEIVRRFSKKVVVHEGCILTFTRWMKKSEMKDILPLELSYPVCDMETFFLTKLSMKRGIPFFAVRSVTDRVDEEVPRELFDVSDDTGNYRSSLALRLLLCKPYLIPNSIKLGRNARIASRNLWYAVKTLLEILSLSSS